LRDLPPAHHGVDGRARARRLASHRRDGRQPRRVAQREDRPTTGPPDARQPPLSARGGPGSLPRSAAAAPQAHHLRVRAPRRRARPPDVPGIGVVVNPHARGNLDGGGERAERLAEVVGHDGVVRVTQSVREIQDVAREFRERGTEILAICGGDGSYHCTLSGFRAVYGDEPLPLLLPLRAGTINYVADATGGRRGRPEGMLARVVRDYRTGHNYETTERDLLRVNGVEHGCVLSFGTAVNYLRAYYAMEKQGPLHAARLLARLIFSALAGTHAARAVFQATA